MSNYTTNQKNKVLKKLKFMKITNEKEILNLKVAKLKEIENITMKDIEIIWEMQEAIEKNTLLEFFCR